MGIVQLDHAADPSFSVVRAGDALFPDYFGFLVSIAVSCLRTFDAVPSSSSTVVKSHLLAIEATRND